MIVIADTTPLHYLVLLNHGDILQELYGRVTIPEAVFRELQGQALPPSSNNGLRIAPIGWRCDKFRYLRTSPRRNSTPANEKRLPWRKPCGLTR